MGRRGTLWPGFWLFLTVATLALTLPARAAGPAAAVEAASPKPVLAVTPFIGGGFSKPQEMDLPSTVAAAFHEALAQTGSYAMTDLVRTERAFYEIAARTTWPCGPGCASAVAKRMAARYIVLGDVYHVESTYYIRARLFDGEKAEEVRGETATCASLEEVIPKTRQLAALFADPSSGPTAMAAAGDPAPAVAAAVLSPAEAADLESLSSRPDAPGAGQVWKNPKDGLDYVWIPPGKFEMGCSPGNSHFYYGCDGDETPRHAVTLSKGFWMCKTEVTVAAYKKFCSETGRPMPPAPSFNSGWGADTHPVVDINWDDAQAYCQWVKGRLPTEAEWEYACRAGTDKRFYWGDSVDPAYCWFSENADGQTHPVAQKSPNRFGLYDMLGNASEWTADWYHERSYGFYSSNDPVGPGSGEIRVMRGGSWLSLPWGVRASFRGGRVPGESPAGRCSECGFRSVITPK